MQISSLNYDLDYEIVTKVQVTKAVFFKAVSMHKTFIERKLPIYSFFDKGMKYVQTPSHCCFSLLS
jgi:hypothetical protein